MKRTLILTLALLFSSVMFSQNQVYLKESFDGNNLPEGWETSVVGAENWSISASSHAGGEPNELKLDFYPPLFMETTRVITPAIDLSSVNDLIINFKHCLNNNIDPEIQTDPYIIGIATSTDKSKWNVAWSEEYKISGTYEVFEFINTPDFGNENVYFSLFFTGSTLTLNGWVFDDIVIYSQDNLDLEMTSVDVPEFSNHGEHEISFSVQNIGATNISSFEVKLECTGDEKHIITEKFETKLESLDIQQYTFSQKIDIIPGSYNLRMEITSVNEQTDGNENNNVMEKDIAVGMGYASRIPMIEHFSSSTCDFCVGPNKVIEQVIAANPGKYTYTKYPIYWPGIGDPYCTDEVRNRVKYYKVSSAPEFYLDAALQENVVTEEALNAAYGSPTFFDIRGAFTVSAGYIINITADFMSYIKMDSIRAFISINEKTTTNNVGSNGETEFHHIMMKMLNDDKGNALNFNAGEYQRLEFSYDMSETFVEDITDLEVALWLQNYETKEIYNSRFAYEYAGHCYPIQNITYDNDGTNHHISWEIPEKGNPIGYNIFINNKLTAEGITNLSYNFTSSEKTFIVEVVALYEEGKTSVSVAKVFRDGEKITEKQELQCNIYPNPVNDKLYIETEAEVLEVSVYDVYGRQLTTDYGQQTINVAELNSGVYFVRIKTNDGIITKQFVKE